MVTHATVKLWGNPVGLVIWNEAEQRAQFQFDRRFARSGLDVAPIMMPLDQADGGNHVFAFENAREDTFKGMPGLLADCLPDRFGEQLMNAWLMSQGRQPGTANPVERLCYTGSRGMGALEFEPAHHEMEPLGETLEVEELVKVAGQVLDTRKKFVTRKSKGKEEELREIMQVGTSAGGARAKAIVAYNADTGEVRSGQVDGLKGFTYCLIKFDGVTADELRDPKGFGRIEYAYYLMARECGVEMMPCRLLEEHRRAHFLTQRFDRVRDDKGRVHKLHMATLCGMAHMDYNEPLAYSYEQAFAVMRQLGLPYPAAAQFFRRMCFNAIARNHDDHTKNTSFLMDPQGDWHLAPAYDMTFAFNPGSIWLRQHQLSINGKRIGITRADLLKVAKDMNIKKADEIIGEVKAGVRKWKRLANEAGVLKKQVEAIGALHLTRL
ncbi:MAG: type II toxin-antitoxin system HipA family toxin [Flavobacteriales bacterium]